MEGRRAPRRSGASGTGGWCGSTASTPRRASTGPGSWGRTRRSGRRWRPPSRSPSRDRRAPTAGHGRVAGAAVVRVSDRRRARAARAVRAGRPVTSRPASVRSGSTGSIGSDVTRWLDALASGGTLSRRSVEICRTVLRAALTDAVDEGPHHAQPGGTRADATHGGQAGASEGSRRVERRARSCGSWRPRRIIGGRSGSGWCVVRVAAQRVVGACGGTTSTGTAGPIRIDEGLIAIKTGVQWSDGKTVRSRRVIALDPVTMRVLANRRRQQAEERLAAGSEWIDEDMILATRMGVPVLPAASIGRLALIIEKTGLPRLDVARAPAHGGHAHGPERLGHRRAPSGGRRARARARRAHAHLRPHAAGEHAGGERQDQPARRRLVIVRAAGPGRPHGDRGLVLDARRTAAVRGGRRGAGGRRSRPRSCGLTRVRQGPRVLVPG